ncbi:hypothetical protein PWT90_01154 [Aphanocladium album]|nr:hypothetical protein PWT90_01154 [Aphanocladium album]
MLLRRGQNRWLVFCAALIITFLLVVYYGDELASMRRMTSTAWAPPAPQTDSTTTTVKPETPQQENLKPLHNDAAEIELVVATTSKENITWLEDYLLDWPKNLYVVDDPDAALTVPQNKGREAMVVLTYLIDRYDTLPANILFHHAERFQWHNDDPDYDALQLLKRFRVAYLQEQGYVNLRCAWILGCPVEIRPRVDAKMPPDDVVPTAKHVYSRAFGDLFPGVDVPSEVGVPCCAQFGVTREAVRARPRQDYVRYREWLLNTDLQDSISGRVFEYSWHIIFNKEAVHCPHAGDCYCKQYGICHRLDCDENGCPGQYNPPQYSTLPKGWPMLGWDGEDRHWSGEL